MTNKLASAVVVGAFLAGGALAQDRVEPHEPAAPVVPATQTSPFDGYRPYRDEPVASWREVNDAVREAGGHVGILRAEQQDAARPAAERPSGDSPAAFRERKQQE